MAERADIEQGLSLWRVIAAPIIWALHFTVCYVGASVYCAKAGRAAPLEPAMVLTAAATVAALAAIGYVVARTWAEWGVSMDRDLVYEAPVVEERQRFLSHVTLMLSALSAVGVVFVALPAFLLETCI